MSDARIEVYVDGRPLAQVLSEGTGKGRGRRKPRRSTPLQEFAARALTDPNGARHYWESGGGVELSKAQLATAWRSVTSLDLSNQRMRKMRQLASTFAATGHAVIPQSLIESLRVGYTPTRNGGDADEPEVMAMTGLEVLGVIGAVAGLVAIGIWIGDTIEDATNDEEGEGESEGGDTVTVNNNGNGDVEVNK